MILNRPQPIPTETYLKQAPGLDGAGAAPTAAASAPQNKKRVFGFDLRSLVTVLGLALFFVGAMAGVVISIRQRISEDVTAPNAPQSRPKADVTQIANCGLSFFVAPQQNPVCDDLVLLNEAGTATISANTVEVGDQVRFRCVPEAGFTPAKYFFTHRTSETASLREIYSGDSNMTFPIEVTEYMHVQCNPCGNNVCASADNINTSCNFEFKAVATSPSPSPSVSPSPTPSVTPTPTPTPTPSPSPSPSPSVSYTCNTSCTGDSQCQSANAAYICANSAGNRCRLYNNTGSETCTPPTNTYTCNSSCSNDSQCQTANSGYVCYNSACRLGTNPNSTSCQSTTYVYPSPTLGCNASCVTNADCTNSSHICFSTSSGNRCRHQDYVNSESCSAPSIVNTYTPVAQPGQPVLPPVLPQTGAEDLGKMLWAGLGVLGVGAVILLLL